jgi:hypothetical protein
VSLIACVSFASDFLGAVWFCAGVRAAEPGQSHGILMTVLCRAGVLSAEMLVHAFMAHDVSLTAGTSAVVGAAVEEPPRVPSSYFLLAVRVSTLEIWHPVSIS